MSSASISFRPGGDQEFAGYFAEDGVDLPGAGGGVPGEGAVGDVFRYVNLLTFSGKRNGGDEGIGRFGGVEFAFEGLAAGDIEGAQDDVAGGIVGLNPRATEGPAGAVGEVHAEAKTFGLFGGVGEELHPARGEIRNLFVIKAFDAVDRADFDASESGLLKEFKLGGETLFFPSYQP